MSGRDDVQPRDPAEQLARVFEELRTIRNYVDSQLGTDRVRMSAIETNVAAIGAEHTWLPVFDQTGTVAATVNHAAYSTFGGWCIGEFQITATGAGAGGPIRVSRPLAGASFVAEIMAVGAAYTLDAAGGIGQLSGTVVVLGNEPTWFRFIRDDVAVANYFGTDPAFTVAAGDKLGGFFAYRTA